MLRSLVGSEMCIRDRRDLIYTWNSVTLDEINQNGDNKSGIRFAKSNDTHGRRACAHPMCNVLRGGVRLTRVNAIHRPCTSDFFPFYAIESDIPVQQQLCCSKIYTWAGLRPLDQVRLAWYTALLICAHVHKLANAKHHAHGAQLEQQVMNCSS